MATVNGTGSASANSLLMQAIFRMGMPGHGQEHLPVEHPGPAHVVRDPRQRRTATSPRPGRVDLDGRAERRDLRQGRGQVRPGGYLMYDSSWPRRAAARARGHHHPRRAARADLQRDLRGRPRPHAAAEHRLRRRAGGAARDRHGSHRADCSTRSSRKKPALLEANMKAIQLGYDYARAHLPCPLPFHLAAMDKTRDPILIDGNTAAALGAVYAGATVGAVVSDHAVHLADGLVQGRSARSTASTRRPGAATTASSRPRTSCRRSAWCIGAGWMGARAFTPPRGPGISLMRSSSAWPTTPRSRRCSFDVQRVGPSTGMPTRTQQCDLMLCAYASHGDTKHMLLFPAEPGECFEMAVQAFDLAERLQTPVFVVSDLDIGMNDWMVPRARVGRRLPARPRQGADAAELEECRSSTATSTWTATALPRARCRACTPKGAYFTRGSGHDKYGAYTEDSARVPGGGRPIARKFKTPRKTLVPPPVIEATAPATIGLVTDRQLRRRRARGRRPAARSSGIHVDYMRIKAFPFGEEVESFLDRARDDLRRRAEPRRAAARAADARDRRARAS